MNRKKNKIPTNIYDITKLKPHGRKQKAAARKKKSLTPRQKRRLTGLAVLFFAAVAMIFGIVFLVSQMLFKVDSITVKYSDDSRNTKRHYTDGEIASNTAVDKGDNLLFLNTDKIADELEKALPYIGIAVVKKDYPSCVVVEITESNQVYCFKTSSGYYLVNDSGKLLEKTTEEATKKYVKVTCNDVNADVLGEKIEIGEDTDKILEYLQLVNKSGMKIRHINFTDINDIKMNYDNRIVIHIGKMAHEDEGVTAWKKIQLAKKALEAEDKSNPDQKGTLNMTIAKKAYFSVKSETSEKVTKPAEKNNDTTDKKE